MGEGRNGLKAAAKLAKNRLKNGFWEEYREKVEKDVKAAETTGHNGSNVISYYRAKLVRNIGKELKEDSENFYKKVKSILDQFGEVSDIIGRLCDEEYMKTLCFIQQQRYVLELSEKYLAAKDRYYEERNYLENVNCL